MNITTIALDLAKNVFQLRGLDEQHKTVLRKTLKRGQMQPFLANLPPSLAPWKPVGVRVPERKLDPTDSWLKRLVGRRHKNVAAAALANKNARIVWALLARNRAFRPDYVSAAVG